MPALLGSSLALKQLSGAFAAYRLMRKRSALIGGDLEEGSANHISAEEAECGSCSVPAWVMLELCSNSAQLNAPLQNLTNALNAPPITQQMNAPAQVFFFNILHLNAEECLHIRINVSLRRDKYDFNVSSEKLHWGTILLSTVSKA